MSSFLVIIALLISMSLNRVSWSLISERSGQTTSATCGALLGSNCSIHENQQEKNLSIRLLFSLIILNCYVIRIICVTGNGYALVWDNTQKLVRRRDHSRDSKNKMLLWANAYAALNRIEFSHFENQQQKLPFEQIPLSSFLPSTEDCSSLRLRMKTLISRILVSHVTYFKEHCSGAVVWHVPHMYSEKSAIKSQLVWMFILNTIFYELFYNCLSMTFDGTIYARTMVLTVGCVYMSPGDHW